jgi:hypothetical protein
MTLITVNVPVKALCHAIEGGGYWAEIKEFPGCVAQAETLDELEKNQWPDNGLRTSRKTEAPPEACPQLVFLWAIGPNACMQASDVTSRLTCSLAHCRVVEKNIAQAVTDWLQESPEKTEEEASTARLSSTSSKTEISPTRPLLLGFTR